MKKSSLITAALLLAALTAFAPALQAQGTLKGITAQKDGAQLVVMIAVEGAFTRETSFLTSPKRLVIDLNAVSTIAAAPYTQVGEAGVLDIRTGQFKPETARVVFDLGSTTPAYSIAVAPEGLKLVFWLEAADVQDVPPVRQPARETERQATERASAPTPEGRRGFFLRAGAGKAFFLKPDFLSSTEFALYGETASLSEAYTWNSGVTAEVGLGMHFRLGSLPTQAGLEVSFWGFKPTALMTMSLPHPYLTGANRSVEFKEVESLAQMFVRFSAFAQFSFLETDKFAVWLGPVAGITTGKIVTLEDYSLEEKAPYGAVDVIVADKTYFEESFSRIHFGAALGLEYRITEKLSLSLDTKFLLLSPASLKFVEGFNLMHLQPTLSLKYDF